MNLATVPPLDLTIFNDRERNLLRCLARGWPTAVIATELGYSYGYIKTQTASCRIGSECRRARNSRSWHGTRDSRESRLLGRVVRMRRRFGVDDFPRL